MNVEVKNTVLSDRNVVWDKMFGFKSDLPQDQLEPELVKVGPGRRTPMKDHVRVDFDATEQNTAISQQLRFDLPEPAFASGMGMRVRLRGWDSISYIAIGHTEDGSYRHAKAAHPLQGDWFDFNLGFADLAWGWSNGWDKPDDRLVSDVRFYIKGVPGPNAGCDLQEVRIWREAEHPDAVFGEKCPTTDAVVDLLHEYQRAYFPEYVHLARSYLETGKCPLAGGLMLDWPVDEPLPPRLSENGTFQYSWHSQHPAVLLMLLAANEEATDRERAGALFAARDLISDWMTRSFDKPDPNVKYAWYDHGVAERLLALIMLHAAGDKEGFDVRFMTRLRRAIHRHAQLLASEIFYAGHQPIRYHNHAWFQDLALMATGLAFPGWACADLWIETALARVSDQFEKLIIRDGDFAVFAENSIGYHFGIGRLVANIGRFAALSGRDTGIPEIAEALGRFSTLMRYPDGKRSPGQGDTFRLSNTPNGDPAGRKPYGRHRMEILPNSGYAIAQGDHAGRPYMLCFFATSATSTHKHADNQSFTLYLDGIEWLIDPSFHSHEYSNPAPKYLRSPEAHNAFVLPGRPYAIDPGLARLWGEVDEWKFVFEGSHDAVEGARFQRRIVGQKGALDLAFADRIVLTDPGIEADGVRLMLHCGEGVEVHSEGVRLMLTHPASALTLRIALPEGCRLDLIRDRQVEPIRGVAGNHFLELVAITSIEIALPVGETDIKWRLFATDWADDLVQRMGSTSM